jgi:outer membrane lipoprotein-sorting protein
MNDGNADREESRFRDVLGSIEAETPRPDEAFLERLKAETTSEFLAAAQAAPGQKREKLMHVFKRYIPATAAALVLIGVALVAFLAISVSPSIAWADVQKRVTEAQTATFAVTMACGGAEGLTWAAQYKSPGHMRMTRKEMISIFDFANGRLLILDPSSKFASTTEMAGMGEDFYGDWLADLKAIVGSREAQRIGEKKIDGRDVVGWRMSIDEEGCEWQTATVWADAETAELVEAEMTALTARMTLNDIKLGVELDEKLFDLTPPEGYRHSKARVKRSECTVEDVAMLLRIWAGGSGGVLPDDPMKSWEFTAAAARFDWRSLFAGVAPQDIAKRQQELSETIHEAFTFFGIRMNWMYAGKGVKVGDADTVIFWYLPDPKGKTAEVIYGDLTVGEMPVNKLPKSSDDE